VSWSDYQIRSSTRFTCTADHLPPRAVGMPCALSPAAMARSDVAPAACKAVIVGPMSVARSSARCFSAAVDSARIFAVGFTRFVTMAAMLSRTLLNAENVVRHIVRH
jgi:hypothetical protein